MKERETFKQMNKMIELPPLKKTKAARKNGQR